MSIDLKTLAGRLTPPESFFQRIHPEGTAGANYVGELASDRAFPIVEFNLRIGNGAKSATRLFGHGLHWTTVNRWPKFGKLMGDADGLSEAAAKAGMTVDDYSKLMRPRAICAVSSPSGKPTFACIRHDLMLASNTDKYHLGLESHRKTAVKIQGVVKDVLGSFRSLSAMKRNVLDNITYTTERDDQDMLVTVTRSIFDADGTHLLFKEVAEACDELILEGGAPAFVCDYQDLTDPEICDEYQSFLLGLSPFQQLLVVRVAGLATGVPEKIFFQPLPLGAAGAYLYVGAEQNTWASYKNPKGSTSSMPIRVTPTDVANAGGDEALAIRKKVNGHAEEAINNVEGYYDSGSWVPLVHSFWYFRPTQPDMNWPSINMSGSYAEMNIDGSKAKSGSVLHNYIMDCAQALGFYVDPSKAGAFATSFAGAVISAPLGMIAGLPHEPEIVMIELDSFERHDSTETLPDSAWIRKWEAYWLPEGKRVDFTRAQPKRVMKWTANSVVNRITGGTLHKAISLHEQVIPQSQADLKLEALRFPWHFAGSSAVKSSCVVPYKDLKLINQLKRAGGSDDDLTLDDGDDTVITFAQAYDRAVNHKVTLFYGSVGTELAQPGNVPAALWIEGEAPNFKVFVYAASGGPTMVKGAELTKEDAALFHMMGASLYTAPGIEIDDAVQALFNFPDSDTMNAVVLGASADISLDDATLSGAGMRFSVMSPDELTRFHVMQSIKDRHHLAHLCCGALTGALGSIPFTEGGRDFTEEEVEALGTTYEALGYQF